MEHNKTYALMMAALDGELAAAGRQEMEAHLATCPACRREWLVLLAIHDIFRRSPILLPAAGFAQRTLARLPNRRQRLGFMVAVYLILLVSGIVPMVLVALAANRLGPALEQPAVLPGLQNALGHLLRLAGSVASTLWQGLTALGEAVAQQPALVGGLLLMAGFVALWASVYRQMTAVRILSNE